MVPSRLVSLSGPRGKVLERPAPTSLILDGGAIGERRVDTKVTDDRGSSTEGCHVHCPPFGFVPMVIRQQSQSVKWILIVQ